MGKHAVLADVPIEVKIHSCLPGAVSLWEGTSLTHLIPGANRRQYRWPQKRWRTKLMNSSLGALTGKWKTKTLFSWLSDKEAAHHHWHFFCNVPSASMPGDRREREKGRSGKVCPFPADECVRWCVSRYGLPVNFQAMLLQPNRKSVKRLRDVLNVVFKHLDEVAAASIMDVCIWTASAHALACLSFDKWTLSPSRG